MTDYKQLTFAFQPIHGRRVEVDFQGGEVTSDAGALLLGEADHARDVLGRVASNCFADGRDPSLVKHSLEALLRQRVFAMVLGYEDVNDHDQLRHDLTFRTLCGDSGPDDILAGKSTLNRVEVSACETHRDERYHKIHFSLKIFHALLRDLFFESYSKPPTEIVLDLDATDFKLHGQQENRFYHGYYREHCYLPLYIFANNDHLLHCELRPSNIDAAKGSIEALAPIIAEIKKRWPACRIIVRGDSGFCREEIMNWLEERGALYILGLAQNARLRNKCSRAAEKARRRHLRTGEPARIYTSFGYRTLKSWSRKRRVVAKSEHLRLGPNPRFVVTNLAACEMSNRDLYERGYCPRGDMENRIKEQLDLFADRVSCESFKANQLRMVFSAIGYVLLNTLRQALAGTELARAQPDTIRLRLLKIGARVRVSVRRVLFSLASGYPWKDVWEICWRNLRSMIPEP